ncbi:MAG: Ig-like domain-containing protein, partial [Desulfobacteraceae bacterium]
LTASPSTISADGSSSSSITAIVKDSSGDPVPKGTSVTFTTSLGTFQNKAQTYEVNTPNETGQVTVSLKSENTPGVAIVTASADIDGKIVTQSTEVTFASYRLLSLQAVPETIAANDSDESTITATLTDEDLVALEGITITFTTNLGTFTGDVTTTTVATDVNGEAEVKLKAANDGIATVEAECTGASDSVQVTVTEP